MGNKSSNPCVIDVNANINPVYESKETHLSPTTQLHLTSRPSFSARLSSHTPKSDSSFSTPTKSNPSFPLTPIARTKQSPVCNGITGTYISGRIITIAASFWRQNVENLKKEQRLEIGCSILFGALCSNKEMKDVIKAHLIENHTKIAEMGLKILDMIGFLLTYLVKDDIDVCSMLCKLGIFHQKIGIKMNHFAAMLDAVHDTFSYYFPTKYDIEVKYAMDEIFSLSSQIMSGQDLQCSPRLSNLSKSFENENNIAFIQDLRVCLKSTIGKEYFYRYLQQTFCDEIVIFLQLLAKFKGQSCSVQRFMVARDIIRSSIDPNATFTLNLSFECRSSILTAMQELEQQFMAKEDLNVETQFFEQAELETYKLILHNHWNKFVNNIQSLHQTSFGKINS